MSSVFAGAVGVSGVAFPLLLCGAGVFLDSYISFSVDELVWSEHWTKAVVVMACCMAGREGGWKSSGMCEFVSMSAIICPVEAWSLGCFPRPSSRCVVYPDCEEAQLRISVLDLAHVFKLPACFAGLKEQS